MSNLYNNNGISTFSIVSTDALFIAGKRFKDYITEIQTELDFEAAEIELLKAFADRIDISGLTGTLILNDENRNQILKGLIEAIQSEQTTQNNNITALQNSDSAQNAKLQYWNNSGTMYNNTGGNGGISSLTAQTAVVIAGSNNSFMQVGGSSGISIEGGSNGLYLSSTNDVIIDTKDNSKNIRIGMNTSGNYGNSTIDIGGGGSLIRIGNEQTTISIPPANGPVIYIGQKNTTKSDSTTHFQGNFLLEKAQFTDLNASSAITWEQLASLIPTVGIPAYCLSFILTSSLPNFIYSDLWAMKSTAFQKFGEAETVLSPKCKSLLIFNSEVLTVTEPALKVFTVRGSSTISTLEGDNNLYTFLGKNVIRADGGGVISGRIDDGDFNSIITDTNYTQMNCSNGNLELVALNNANINLYAGSAVRNIHKTAAMSVKNDRRILMAYKSDEKTPSTESRLTIKNGSNVLGTPQETNLLTLENEAGSIISTLNANNISNQSLTLQSGYSGTTTATLYKDNNNNLFWNGRNISNYTAGTASTYIFSISSNVTTPPAVGTLNLTYTSTPLYYINYTGYAVATELEVGTFTSPNIDLIANPFISAGLWSFNYHTTLTANVEVRSYFKVYVQETVTATNNSTTTLLKDGSTNYVLLTPSGILGTYALTYNELYIPYYQFPNLTTCTYKIIIKAYIYQPSGTTCHNVRFGFNDTALSHVHTTFQNVSATSTLQNVLLAGNTCGNTPINMNGQAIQNASDILPQANNDLVVGSKATSTGKTYIYANAAPKITATSAGVGIGTTTAPAYPLDVGGDINLTGNLKINGVTQTFGGSQNLSSVLTNGNTANTSINMNDNNITGLNKILGTSSGSLIIRDSSDIGGLRISGGRIGVNSEPHYSYLIDCAGDINVQAGFNFRKGGALIGESQIRDMGGGYLEWATNQYSWTLNSSNFLPTGGINCQAQKVFLTINLWNDSNSDNGTDDSYYFQFNGYTANTARYQSNMQLSFNGGNYTHNLAINYAFHVSRYAGNIITLKIEVEKLRPYYWGIVFRAYCGDFYIPSVQFSNNWGDMMNNACFFYDATDSNVFSSLRIYSQGSAQPFTNLNCVVHTLDRSSYYIAPGEG